jgi:hypothetical protein
VVGAAAMTAMRHDSSLTPHDAFGDLGKAYADRSSVEWVDGGMDIRNGKAVRMITFTSTTCTDGYIKAFDLVGPETDGDTNWRVNLQ